MLILDLQGANLNASGAPWLPETSPLEENAGS